MTESLQQQSSMQLPSASPLARIDPMKALILLAFAWAIVPNLIQYHLGFRPSAQLYAEVSMSPIASLVKNFLQYATYAASVVTIVHAVIGRSRGSNRWLIIYLLPWAALALASVLSTQTFTLSSLIYVAMGFGIANHTDRMSLLRLLGTLTAAVAAISLAMVATTPNALTSQATVVDAKALIGSSLLNGPFPHPNTLGQTLALGFPFVFLIEQPRARVTSLALVLIALVWTASRTSLLAVGISIGVGVLWLAVKKLAQYEKLLPGLPLLAVYGLAVPVTALFVGVAHETSFSNRGIIWQTSLRLWAERPLTGWGADIYGTLSRGLNNIGALAFHGHNMFINTLAIAGTLGGIALLILYVAMLSKSWKISNTGHPLGVAMFPIVFVCLGWFEAPTTFYSLGATSWIAWTAVGTFIALPFDNAKAPVLESPSALLQQHASRN
jgi:hypothetical protein